MVAPASRILTRTVVVPRPSKEVLEDLGAGLDVIASDRCCSAAERASLGPARAWLAELKKAVGCPS
jgi:hypothetical protein